MLLAACVALSSACRDKRSGQPKPQVSASAQAEKRQAEKSQQVPASPTALLVLPTSAYRASLAMDDEAVYVLTSTAMHRVVPGQGTDEVPLDLGFGATLTAHAVLFWSKGALWQAPKTGGEPRRVAPLPHRPQTLVASGDRFAWVSVSKDRKFSLQMLDGQTPHVLYASTGSIDVAKMVDGQIFFVERVAPQSWHLGRVAIPGGHSDFTKVEQGRPPAQLAAFADGIYFRRAKGLEVVRLSLDFQREETLAEGLVCSPMAVWEHVYCAQVGGLVEVLGPGRAPRPFAVTGREPVTAVGANSKVVAWLVDSGPDQLTLKMLPRTQD